MEEDIVPGLLESIKAAFRELYDESSTVAALLEKVQAGTATYAQAQEYAIEVSRLIGSAWGKYISSAVLPDGRMYYNIASRLIPSVLDDNHALVADYAAKVQQQLNRQAGIGIRAQVAPINTDRENGLVNLVSNPEKYDDVSAQLKAAMENFSQAVVDSTLKENVDFQGRAGLTPRIIRRAESGACKWCRALAGVYDYPDVPREAYQRHESCRCVVEYDPGTGKRQNVHTKKWTDPGERDMIEERKKIAISDLGRFNPNEYAQEIRKYVTVDREKVYNAAKSGNHHGHGGVYYDAVRKNKKQLQKSIISHVSQLERHMDKIQHPEKYVENWADRDPRYQTGLIQKWKKDIRRNAEQAEVELAVFEKRFSI